MAVTQTEVDDFLSADKLVPRGAEMRWISRNRHNRRCHLRVEAAGAQVGELILIANVAVGRHWTFVLLRRRDEVLRWDFARAPYRHRNPPDCGPDFPRIVRALEHEHVWRAAAPDLR